MNAKDLPTIEDLGYVEIQSIDGSQGLEIVYQGPIRVTEILDTLTLSLTIDFDIHFKAVIYYSFSSSEDTEGTLIINNKSISKEALNLPPAGKIEVHQVKLDGVPDAYLIEITPVISLTLN